ncbi:MAG: hypothetical protein IPO14_13595 [Saprospiraceae bacterium]|jgi:hypothetical protein|nr:hypothetical protein [Saprospiraceae bacterium]
MRIVKEMQFDQIKATIFINNEKYSIKLDGGGMEQIYKFDSTLDISAKIAEDILDEKFLESSFDIFRQMKKNIEGSVYRNLNPSKGKVEEII